MGFTVSPLSAMSPVIRHHRFRVQAQSLDAPRSPTTVFSSESDSVASVNGASLVVETQHQNGSLIGGNKKNVQLRVEEKLSNNNMVLEEGLAPLWDDGYGTQTVEDYFAAAKEMSKGDGGPPRWFCPVECGPPLKNSPTLLFLPGK